MVMGRPPKKPEECKSDRITVRLHEADMKKLIECQEKLECSRADVIARAIELLYDQLT